MLVALFFPVLSYADNDRNRDQSDRLQSAVSIPAQSFMIPTSQMLYGTIAPLPAHHETGLRATSGPARETEQQGGFSISKPF